MKKIIAKPFLFLLVLLASSQAFALKISEVAAQKAAVGSVFTDDNTNEGINNALSGAAKVVIALAAVLGFVFAFKGLHMIYEASQPQAQTSYAKGIIVVLVGGALVSLPWVVFTSSNTVQAIQL